MSWILEGREVKRSTMVEGEGTIWERVVNEGRGKLGRGGRELGRPRYRRVTGN